MPGAFGALTWNLFHGRDFPPDPALFTWRSRLLRRTERNDTHVQVNRPLREEFARTLDALDWDLALLQEAPPRWQDALCARCVATAAVALTSRHELGRLRRGLADRNPDLIASNEGGSNMVLVRSPGRVVAVERVRLALRPERRALLLARIALPGGGELAVAAMHLSVSSTGRGPAEAESAAELAVRFSHGRPLLFGGDLNLRPAEHAELFGRLRKRFGLAPATSGRSIDHLLGRDLDVLSHPRALASSSREMPAEPGRVMRLSDHAPVAARFGVR